jgi:alkyldihydroxyacetonephosphate synthase
MVLGSEGRLGVITEATVHVHRLPERREIIGYLLPDWDRALAAMNDLAASEVAPSVTRVSDAAETGFSFAMRKRPTRLDRLQSAALQAFLRRRGIDREAMCLAFLGFEGSAAHAAEQRRRAGRVLARHGAIAIGRGPGVLYDQKKFDTPYIRDFLLDRGCLADVSETAAPWSRLPELYATVTGAAQEAFARLGVPGHVMCHLSHSYHAGACLYFTFGINPSGAREPLEEYDEVKSAIQQAFIDAGATLSHHHAVGTEHARWLAPDISPAGVAMLQALFDGVDPGANLNPGKIVPGRGPRASAGLDERDGEAVVALRADGLDGGGAHAGLGRQAVEEAPDALDVGVRAAGIGHRAVADHVVGDDQGAGR